MPTKLRICIVSPYFPSRSVPSYNEGSFLLREAKHLMEHGHKFVAIACRHSGLPQFEIVEGIDVYRISSFLIPKIRYPIPNLLELMATIFKVLKKYRIQLIDFWDQSYLTTLPVVFGKRIIRIPMSVTVGGLMGLNWFYGEKFVDLVGLLHSFSLTKLILACADGVRSEYFCLTQALSKLGIYKKVSTIYRGVDTNVFHPNPTIRKNKRKELGINPNDVVIMYVGRLEVIKGVKYLIKAADRLIKENNHLKCLFIGEGTLRQKYENAKKADGHMIFLGFRSDVAELLSAADIFVLPSLSEGCSAAILEASACGLPIVATKVGGNCETVIDNVTGICVTPRKVDDLTEAIKQLLDTNLAKEMGRNGLAHVKRLFDPEKIAAKVEEYYWGLISNR